MITYNCTNPVYKRFVGRGKLTISDMTGKKRMIKKFLPLLLVLSMCLTGCGRISLVSERKETEKPKRLIVLVKERETSEASEAETTIVAEYDDSGDSEE